MKDKIVIFDWGGVIESHKEGEYCVNKALINLIKYFNNAIDSNNLIKRYYDICANNKIDTQNNENNNFFKEIKKEFDLKCDSKEFYERYMKEFDKIEYYKDVVEYAHTLKDKCKIGILSNLGFLDKQRLDKQVNLKQFDYVWLSFEIGFSKPDERIYEVIEKDCGIKPENILFIDDYQPNIEVANTRGWNTCNAYGYELSKIKESIIRFL